MTTHKDMNKENVTIIHQYIKLKGDEIQSRLPPLPGHPHRRAQAHLYKAIKDSFGIPCKDLPDGRFDEVMKVVNLCVQYAEDPNVEEKYLQWVVPEPPGATLENFFENP